MLVTPRLLFRDAEDMLIIFANSFDLNYAPYCEKANEDKILKSCSIQQL